MRVGYLTFGTSYPMETCGSVLDLSWFLMICRFTNTAMTENTYNNVSEFLYTCMLGNIVEIAPAFVHIETLIYYKVNTAVPEKQMW